MMNLRSLLNSNDDGTGNPPRNRSPPPPPPQQQQQQQQQHLPQQGPPSTPVQTGPSPFRDYSNSIHASPGRALSSHEYAAANLHTPSAVYASPSATPGGGGPGPYGARPVPPPLQTLNTSDLHSPSSASLSGPSPYRHTPSSSSVSSAYPFPPSQPPSAVSPVQHHQQYPPGANAFPPSSRDYPQSAGPVGLPGPPGTNAYMQGGQPPMPQTPPIGPSGGQHAYIHQRSQSTHSTPTPTSAQSQHPPHPPPAAQQQQFGAPYGQPSPVVAQRPPLPQQYQQQPPTPLGPPLSATQQRAPSAGPGYPQQQQLQQQQQQQQQQHQPHQQQPPQQQHQQQQPLPASPLQQRIPSASYLPYQSPQPTNQHLPPHVSPRVSHPSPAPHHMPLDRPSSFASQATYGQISVDTRRRSLSHSDRGRSVSVSPKTRPNGVPPGYFERRERQASFDASQPQLPQQSRPSPLAQPAPTPAPTPAHAPTPTPTPIRAQPPAHPLALPGPAPASSAMDVDRPHNGQTGKRKMDERDLNPDELERKDVRRMAPFEKGSNGVPSHNQTTTAQATAPKAAAAVRKVAKKQRYKQLPVWAQRFDGGRLHVPNFIVHKPGMSRANAHSKSENASSSSHASRHTSRHASPEASRSSMTAAPDLPAAAAAAEPAATAPTAVYDARLGLLGPWEESITGEKPNEEISQKVANFLFFNVVNNPSMAEIQGLGVQFEIEAKLGTLISKDTNERVAFPVASECLLQDTGRVTFRSSMTEAQHRTYNEYLNHLVQETNASHRPNSTTSTAVKARVPLVYKHRREIDRFYELPLELQERLPACVRNLLPRRHGVRVRITYDKVTQQVLAKIVKARIGDLNIHFPDSPLDCRLSVNLEMAWEGPVEEVERLAAASGRERQPDREKDRLSYTHSHYQIDLTQVTYKVPGPNKMEREEKEHELEVELAPQMVIEQGRRAANMEPHAYRELVDGLLDNIRILTRPLKKIK